MQNGQKASLSMPYIDILRMSARMGAAMMQQSSMYRQASYKRYTSLVCMGPKNQSPLEPP